MKGQRSKQEYCTFIVHINPSLISVWPGLEHNKTNPSIDSLHQMTTVTFNKTLYTNTIQNYT